MIKRTQNRVAESRFMLPVVVAYAIAVWLASGLLIPAIPITSAELLRGAWVQFACFLISAYLMVELNNSNALIRIYSRSVSCSFIVLVCAGCFLFSSLGGAIVQLCMVAAFIAAFRLEGQGVLEVFPDLCADTGIGRPPFIQAKCAERKRNRRGREGIPHSARASGKGCDLPSLLCQQHDSPVIFSGRGCFHHHPLQLYAAFTQSGRPPD
jgi:hypothetical protein